MEIRLRSKKGMVMTVLMLVLFMLILAQLLFFVLLSINYNNLDQSIATSSVPINYAKILSSSANLFANASLNRAISVLAAVYESNALGRGPNFIGNTSLYL